MISLFSNVPRSTANPQTIYVSCRLLGRKPPKPGKPPNLPPAKKVLYRVPHPEWMKPEDIKELLWRRHAYNNAIMSIRAVFKKEIETKEAAGLGIESLKAREKDELDALILENERRNLERARQREVDEKVVYEQMKSEFLADIESKLEKQDEIVRKSVEDVTQVLELADSFVTKDNLEEKLKEALESPVVFDYCIDLKGQKFYDPPSMKYVEGTPTRQKGRIFDRSLMAPRNIQETAASSS